MNDTEKQKIIAEIINILSYQQVITNQGINYTGEKDWALNKILALLDKTIKSKLEAVGGEIELKRRKHYNEQQPFLKHRNDYNDAYNKIIIDVLEIINKHKYV